MGAPLRILEVSPSFDPAHAFGGPIASTRELCRRLAADPACEVRVLTTDAASPLRPGRLAVPAGWHRHSAGFAICYCRWVLPRDLAPGLLARLLPALRWAEVVHLNGVYSFTTPAVLLLARLFGRPVLWSTRGALMDPGHGEGRAKRLWDRACRLLADRRRCLVLATGPGEASSVRRRLPGFAVADLPNGVDGPAVPLAWTAPPDGVLRLLFIGRLHPIKALDRLIEALSLTRHPARLTIYGDGGEDCRAALEALAARLGLGARVRFAGFLPPAGLSAALATHDGLALPSHSENFGMAAAEALAHGRPVIASTGTPWAALDEHDCGAWVANDPPALAAAIDRLAGADIAAMGRRAHHWMTRTHSWEALASRFRELACDLARPPARIGVIASVGGHLTEVRALAPAFAHLPHFYVLNDHVALPDEMAGRTHFITHAERDWRVLLNFWELWRIFARERPDILLSTGAGPAVPAAIVGRLLFGCRVIFVESMTRVERPSLTARLIRPFTDHLLVQWPALVRHLPGSRHAGRLL